MIGGANGESTFARCDVTSSGDIDAALQTAIAKHGGLDIVVNNAGIGDEDLFCGDGGNWRQVVEIDLVGVNDGTRQAVLRMKGMGRGGAIVNTGSMIGLWPEPAAPVYAAAKAGVVNFTRSLGYLAEESGIRVNTICPELVDTPLAAPMGEEVLERARREGGILQPGYIAAAIIDLIEDESRAGAILEISITDGQRYVTQVTQPAM
jgi:NAD(P)-dependent dehydrogenase (short-subunit alcohol dehydrogenase family)